MKQREDLNEKGSQKNPQTAYRFWGDFSLTEPLAHFFQTQKHTAMPVVVYTPKETSN